MKFFVVLACIVATAFAANEVNVLHNDAEVNPDSFKYAYELDNKVKADQEGSLKGPENFVISGQYSYVSPEGEQISVQYTADENGYQVSAANPALPTPPTPPPVPEAILKSLAYIAAHPPKKE